MYLAAVDVPLVSIKGKHEYPISNMKFPMMKEKEKTNKITLTLRDLSLVTLCLGGKITENK